VARIFLSHSSENNAEAVALRDWLNSQGWDDLFLDLDPVRGIAAGERWERALYKAADRCEAVIFLVSRAWLASRWCLKELQLAQKLNKRLFGVLIEDLKTADLPEELTEVWQVVRLDSGTDHRLLQTMLPGGEEAQVTFSKAGLERLKSGLVKAGLDPRFFAWPPNSDPYRSPYRGLRALEADDAGIFFGREAPIIAGLDRLRGLREAAAPRALVVLGASGAGKSSYLRAGLLARLARDDRSFLPLPPIRPERAAIGGETGLLRVLELALRERGPGATRAQLREAVASGAAALLPLLCNLARQASPPALEGDALAEPPALLLAVDQAEELFQAEGAAESEALLELLRGLALAEAPKVILVFTIRSDSFEQLQSAPALQDLPLATLSLPPMPRGSYQQVIEGPAQRLSEGSRALRIDPALTEQLLTDIEEGGGKDALPLLAFSLERLYVEYGGDGDLRLDEYRAIGGIEGSIEAAVERALAAADDDPKVPADREQRLALLRRALIPWLAGIDPASSAPRRRVARLSEIPAETRALVQHLIEQRLLSTDVAPETGEVTVEPAHEALLRQWSLLKGWLADDFAALATLEGVQRATRDWVANGQNEAWLAHSAGRLEDAEALLLRQDLSAMLGSSDAEYLAHCRQSEARRRDRALQAARDLAQAKEREARANARVKKRTLWGLAAAVILAVAAGTAAIIANDKAGEAAQSALLAERREQEARAAQRDAERSAARFAVTAASTAIDLGDLGGAAETLLQAATSFDDATAPEEMQIAFHRLNEAMERTTVFNLPPAARAFEGPDALYFVDDDSGDVLRFDGNGPPVVLMDGSSSDPEILELRALGDGEVIVIRADGAVQRFTPRAGLRTVDTLPMRQDGYDNFLIGSDGTVFWQQENEEDDGDRALVRVIDARSGRSFEGVGYHRNPRFAVTPEGRRYVISASDPVAAEIVEDGDALRLLPVAASTELSRKLLSYACFQMLASSPPADDLPTVDSLGYGPIPDQCLLIPGGVIHSRYTFGSAGIFREDAVVLAGSEEPRLVEDIVSNVLGYELLHNISWIGYQPELSSFVVLVNRDLLVFTDDSLELLRKHPVAVGPARVFPDGRIAVVERGANRVTVHSVLEQDYRKTMRAALSRDDEAAVVAGESQLSALNKGTCGDGPPADYENSFNLPDGTRIDFDLPENAIEIVRGQRSTVLPIGDSDCFQFTPDWKHALIGTRDPDTYEMRVALLDFESLLAGGPIDESEAGRLPGTFRSAFPLAGGDIVTTDGSEAVRRWHRDESRRWVATQIYRGDYAVLSAEPNLTGEQLLILEDFGGGNVRGFLYSVPASQRWIEIGSDYKWFRATFSDDGGIVSGSASVWRYIDIPSLSALVAETRERLSRSETPH